MLKLKALVRLLNCCRNPSVKAVWADKYDTNMVAKSRIYNPNRSRITTVGIQVRDGNNIIGRKEEMMNSNYQYKEQTNFWFDFNAELGLRLRPGHVYGWQMYADIGGKDVIRIGLMTVQQEQKNQTHRLLVRQRHIMLLVML